MRTYTILFLSLVSTFVFAQSEESELNSFIDPTIIKMVSGYDQELRNAPGSATIITAEEIQKTGSYRLSDVLERITGLHISPSSDAVATLTTIRGITGRILILYNGVPLAQSLVNATGNIDSILLHDIERIEVLKGPNSAVYGADAVTGTVNLITYAPGKDNDAAGVLVGEDSTRNVWFRQSGALFDSPYAVYFGRHETDGSDATINIDRQTAIDQQLGTNASNAPGPANQEKEINEFRFTVDLPHHFTWRSFIYDQRDLGTGVGNSQSLDPQGENNYTLYTSELIYRNKHNGWDVDSNLSFAQVDASGDNARLLPAGTLGGVFPDGVIQNLGVQETRWRYELTGTKTYDLHTIRIGGGVFESEWENKFDRRNYTIRPESPFPIPVGQLTEFRDIDPIFSDQDTDNVFAYLQDEWQFANDWRLTTGVRVDDYSTAGTTINPRVGLVWNAGQNTSVKFLYGEAFRPPSPIENSSNGLFLGLGDPDLDPTKQRMGEITIEHAFSKSLSTSLGIHASQRSDVIGLVANASSPNGLGYVNLPGTRDGHGVDWDVKWQLNSNASIKLGWAYQDTDELANDNSTRFSAKNLVSAELDYGLPSDWHLNVFAFGVYDRDRAGTDSRPNIDDYQIVNLAITKENIYKNLDVAFSVQNLFDEDAREPIALAIVEDFPVYTRQAYLQLSVDF